MHKVEDKADIHPLALREQFDTVEQQRDASTLGMWIFLITEVMFFGGMFLAYSIYRSKFPYVFDVASSSMNVYLGAVNTVVLLCSSFTMVMAVRSSTLGKTKAIIWWLIFTLIFGCAFLGVKAIEWTEKFHEHHIPGMLNFHLENLPGATQALDQGAAQIFFALYFCMTGLHALHMVVGVGIISWLIYETSKDKFNAKYMTPVDISGLYWHFVDVVWIFLFPLLYLIDRHLG